jgi:predicted nuclease of restriction endonuclease-like RecB superfamily
MPFPLADLRRSYGRGNFRGGRPEVRPFLLAGRALAEHAPRLRAALDWYRTQTGRRRAEIDFDELAQLVGDYRLARCLASCLQSAYRFVPDAWDAVLNDRGPGAARRLAERGLQTPSALRLYVFRRVNERRGGFVPPEERAAVLCEVAGDLGLDLALLERLLWLDAPEQERLAQVGPAPRPEQLAAAYNRRALETLLARTISAELALARPDGAAVRRVYFLLKRHGLLCDVDLVDATAGASAGICFHVYGPLEVFGPRTRHGERFARVILRLLATMPGVRGTAQVLLNDRQYEVRLGQQLQDALGDAGTWTETDDGPPPGDAWTEAEYLPAPSGAPTADAEAASPAEAAHFDSGVEARLYATLRGMERRGDAKGWRVVREPEPLVCDGVVLIPDFLLWREGGSQPASGPEATGSGTAWRVFVEVIGFWTPSYRQRKRHKLGLLPPDLPLVLAVQEQLVGEFEGLPFPVLPYRQRVSAADLVELVSRRYGRWPDRQAGIGTRLRQLLSAAPPQRGAIPERELAAALGAATPGELRAILAQEAPRVLQDSGWTWVGGAGLCHRDWLAQVADACRRAICAGGEQDTPLEAVREAVAASGLPAAEAAADVLEALLPSLGFEVAWESIFAARVRQTRPTVGRQPA